MKDTLKIDKSSKIIGKVRLGDQAYIAQGSIIKSLDDSVTIENSSWVLENSVIIGSKEYPVKVGQKTVFGHRTVTIGAEIGNLCEIGNNTIFLPGSKIGDMCIFGEGTIIPEGMEVPSGSVVLGRPGRILRKLTEDDKKMIAKMRSNEISLGDFVEHILEFEEEEIDMDNLYEFNGKSPVISESAFINSLAEITGDVIIGDNSYIGAGVRVIGNSHGPIRIGKNVSILENTVLHLLPDNELIIHDNVTIGPNSTIHGTVIEENTIIEAGAIICDYSSIGKNSLVKSGSLVKQRDKFEENSILDGFPAKLVGKTDERLEKPVWAKR